MKRTRLMSKLFSETTPEGYKEIIAEKVDEALREGKATYSEDGEDLTLQEVDGDVLVADHTNGDDNVEFTRISANPDDENDLQVSPIEVEEVDDTETPDGDETEVITTTESETEDPNWKWTIRGTQKDPRGNYPTTFGKYNSEEEATKEMERIKEKQKSNQDKSKNVIGLHVVKFDDRPGHKFQHNYSDDDETEDPIKLCPETHMFYIEGEDDKYPSYAEAKEALGMEEKDETKTESEDQNLKSVEISVLPGKGIEPEADLVEDLEVEIDPDVVGTQRYSMHFKNFSESKAKMLAKLFAESTKALEEMCNCDVDEDVQVKFEGNKMKVMSVTIGKPTRTFSRGFSDDKWYIWNETLKFVAKGPFDTEKEAKDELTHNGAILYRNNGKYVVIKGSKAKDLGLKYRRANEYSSTFSDENADLDKELPENPEEETMNEEVITENPIEETSEEITDETKTESDAGDPKVTLTITNLEPASVSDLLSAGQDEPKTDVEPKVDPNKSDFSPKQFSMTRKESSINPLLTTEIN